MNNIKLVRLQINESKLKAGFESLTDAQISKIKGGQKDAQDSNNVTCKNENDCTKSSNGAC